MNELVSEGSVMTGAEFREAIGSIEKITDPLTGETTIKFDNKESFKTVKRRVKVIARATPEDKFILVQGIQQLGGLIGIAGESIADSEVLKHADVGFCMGKGCDVAKDNADLVIMDNNFASVRRAILWGRQQFENVKKFLQFQLTINFSLVTIVLISGTTTGDIPFNVIQLLWMNLIMDILAAISLGTEPIIEQYEVNTEIPEQPIEKDDKNTSNINNRISRAQKIFDKTMWRFIIVQGSYQIVVCLSLVYFGGFLFVDEPYNLVTATIRENDKPTDKMTVNTIIFTTYFLMNMVNQFNVRIINGSIGSTFCNNMIFWLVVIIEMGITHGMLYLGQTPFGNAVLGVTELTMNQYIICWALALVSMPLAFLSKKIPADNFKKVLTSMDLEPVLPRSGFVMGFVGKFTSLFSSSTHEPQETPAPQVDYLNESGYPSEQPLLN